MRARGHATVTSHELRFGERTDLVLDRLGGLAGGGLVPKGIPRGALRLRLPRNGKKVRDDEIRARRDGRFRIRMRGLPHGVYELSVDLRGVPRPLAMIPNVAVAPGADTRDPRLQDLNLSGTVFRYVVRAVDSAGSIGLSVGVWHGNDLNPPPSVAEIIARAHAACAPVH